MNASVTTLVLLLAERLRALNWRMATAESCTGGGIGYYLTELAGASDWFAGGILAYSNAVKQDALGVSAETLLTQGAVSETTVAQMADGVFRLMRTDCVVAVSGIAGPSGGTADKPVGRCVLRGRGAMKSATRMCARTARNSSVIAARCGCKRCCVRSKG